MSKKVRTDRCINPFMKDGVPNHKGSNLRKISKTFLQERPDFPKNAMICNDCRLKRSLNRSSSAMSLDDSCHSIDTMECDEISSENDVDNPNSSLNNEDEFRSSRLLELEELLQGLKDKFASLEGNDPMKLKFLLLHQNLGALEKFLASLVHHYT